MSQATAPAHSRIHQLDVVRGFAVLGILAVNVIFFAAPWQTVVNPTLPPLAVTPDTLWSWALTHLVFEGKFINLFSMLFGISLYLVGGEGDDAARGGDLRRRLAWLALFGLIHGVAIWYGDVLLLYAISGGFVALARSWRPGALLRTSVILFAFSLLLSHSFALSFDFIPADQRAEIERIVWAPNAADLTGVIAAYRGGWLSGLAQNVDTWVLFTSNGLPSLVPRTAALMMLGLALHKMQFWSGAWRAHAYAAISALGAAAFALIAWQAALNADANFNFAHMQRVGIFANSALSPFVSLGYAALLIMLSRAPTLRWLWTALANVGRMAFSNYIAQSLIMTTLCWGGWRGFGLFGALSRADLWLIVLAIWAAQLIWSALWLKMFAMGPLEWMWRRLTYARPVALAR